MGNLFCIGIDERHEDNELTPMIHMTDDEMDAVIQDDYPTVHMLIKDAMG